MLHFLLHLQTLIRQRLEGFCSNVVPNRIIIDNYIKKIPFMFSATKAKFTRGIYIVFVHLSLLYLKGGENASQK